MECVDITLRGARLTACEMNLQHRYTLRNNRRCLLL